MMEEDKWVQRYLEMAKLVSTWSKDPSTRVGAVAVGKHGQILSTGYNGFPRKIDDTQDRLNDRPTKYEFTIHAEMNIVYNASLTGISLDGSSVYVYGLPVCSECTKGLIQAGVSRVVMMVKASDEAMDRWSGSTQKSLDMFSEAGIEVTMVKEF